MVSTRLLAVVDRLASSPLHTPLTLLGNRVHFNDTRSGTNESNGGHVP
jgi:hypothetical protein